MSRHACAMILLGGWVLVIPPSLGGGKVDPDAPIRTWRRYADYDTREECLQAQFDARNNTFDEKAATSAEMKRHVTSGRCVPTESVDPSEEPAHK